MNKLSVIRGTYEDYIKWNGEQYLNSPFALNIKNGDTHYYYIMNGDEYFSDYCVFVNEDNLVNLTFLDDNKMLVKFLAPVRAVTPGQACVIYDNEYCLGGGIIESVYMNGEKRKY